MLLLYKVSLLFSFLVLLGLFFLAFKGKGLIRNFFQINVIQVRHNQLLSMFRATPIRKGAIIFAGDSITEGGNWDELFEGIPILNRGISGDRTEGLLNRLDEIIRHQPSKLFLCIGTNDLAFGIGQEVIIQNYNTILRTIQEQVPQTKIYVQAILPVGKKVLYGHKNETIIPLNSEIAKLCAKLEIQFIDLYPHFINQEGYLKPEYTNDKLHLLGSAYLHWKALIKTYVDGN